MKTLKITLTIIAALAISSCAPKDNFLYLGWLSGHSVRTDEQMDHYFQKAAECGIDAIYLECHGGVPAILQDSSSFRDSAALVLLRRAAEYAKKYDVELHAWMLATNRGELNLRQQHHDWYAVNRNGESTADIKLYNREHYRFLCPTRPEVIEYLKDRVREIAEVDGVAGIHMDFIRYPDAILPRGLWESRGVYQDKVYPLYDFCYCDACREAYKAESGVDPMEMEDPNADEQWLAFRWKQLANLASEVAAEIQACGKKSSCAVFATPEESRTLVRQDWPSFKNIDRFMPMIYNEFYNQPDEWVETASIEGMEELKAKGNKAELCSGVIGPYKDGRCAKLIEIARKSGSAGISFFSLEAFEREDIWEDLAVAIAADKEAHK